MDGNRVHSGTWLVGVPTRQQKPIGGEHGPETDEGTGPGVGARSIGGIGIDDFAIVPDTFTCAIELRIHPPLRSDAPAPWFDDVGGEGRPGQQSRLLFGTGDHPDAFIVEGQRNSINLKKGTAFATQQHQALETKRCSGGRRPDYSAGGLRWSPALRLAFSDHGSSPKEVRII